MAKRKICVVVTARPSYSRIKSALQAIKEHPDLELQLVVAASALLGRYGTAVRVIEQDGFEIKAKVYNVLEGGSLAAQSKTTGLGIIELSNVFENIAPDAVITVADRFETMSTAIAASYMNIPLIHIQGGEITGNIDEKVRHAITKLADLHFVASEKARERVIRLGEVPEKVFLTGCPSIDLAKEMLNQTTLDFDPYEKYGGVGGQPRYQDGYCVVLQHPVTTEHQVSRTNIEETLYAIKKLLIPTFWFWPNVDAGSDGTSNGIRAFREKYELEHVHFFKNMDPYDFLKLLFNSQCLIGNSSVGIRECSFLGIPVVNIGSRQFGRERGKNVIDTSYNRAAISEAIQRQCSIGKYDGSCIYGQGNAGEAIAALLAKVPLSYAKVLAY